MGKEEKKKTNKRREREREREKEECAGLVACSLFFSGEVVQNCTQNN